MSRIRVDDNCCGEQGLGKATQVNHALQLVERGQIQRLRHANSGHDLRWQTMLFALAVMFVVALGRKMAVRR